MTLNKWAGVEVGLACDSRKRNCDASCALQASNKREVYTPLQHSSWRRVRVLPFRYLGCDKPYPRLPDPAWGLYYSLAAPIVVLAAA